MRKVISRVLLRIAGWKIGPLVEDVPKCVICVAPHTSNFDFILGKLFYSSIGRNAHFLIKKEWFFFPFNLFFNWIGGVPVDRGQRLSVTEQMIEQFRTRDRFQLAITPEGTRKSASEWKKGFYYIAQGANVPIVMAYLDYGKKEVGFLGSFQPTGDVEKDILTIRGFYQGKKGRHPENFVHI